MPEFEQRRNFVYPKQEVDSDPNVVGHWVFVPDENQEVPDISSNGNDGAVHGALSALDGMKFDGVDDNVGITNSAMLTNLAEFSYLLCFKLEKLNATQILLDKDVRRYFYINSDNAIRGTVYYSITNAVFFSNEKISLGLNTVIFTYSESGDRKIKCYINGVESTPLSQVASEGTIDSDVGGGYDVMSRAGFLSCKGIALELIIHNQTITEQQAKDFHNKYASRLTFKDQALYELTDGVSRTPLDYVKGTGAFKAVENTGLDGESKGYECTSDGTLATQSKQAYGTWKMQGNTDGGSFDFKFISGTIFGNVSDGYQCRLHSNKRIYFTKGKVTDYNYLFYTALNYISSNTPYEITVYRLSTPGHFPERLIPAKTLYDAGAFLVTIKGGDFAEETIVDTTGGSGTNPVVDNTYTTSNYAVWDLDVGDRFANVEFKQGIEQ